MLTGRSPLRDVGKQYVADKGDEWSSDAYRDNYLNGLEIHARWLMDSPVGDINLDMVIEAIQPVWHTKTETASKMIASLEKSTVYQGATKMQLTTKWAPKRHQSKAT